MTAALAVAIVGVLLGGGSLVWQFTTWRKSGPIISVSVFASLVYIKDPDGEMNPIEGTGTVTVRTVNTGRMSASVISWGYRLKGDMGATYEMICPSPSPPDEVPPQGHVTYLWELVRIIDGMRARDMQRARGYVRWQRERRSMPIPTVR